MEKKPSDYLLLYLGCNVRSSDMGIIHPFTTITDKTLGLLESGEFVLCLRPLSSMTIQEWNDCGKFARTGGNIKTAGDLFKINAEETAYLISKSFDLFGLIESNLAIDSTTIK